MVRALPRTPRTADLRRLDVIQQLEAVPAAIDWDALTRNAKAVGALLQMWRAIERQREIEADDEEWLMF